MNIYCFVKNYGWINDWIHKFPGKLMNKMNKICQVFDNWKTCIWDDSENYLSIHQ